MAPAKYSIASTPLSDVVRPHQCRRGDNRRSVIRGDKETFLLFPIVLQGFRDDQCVEGPAKPSPSPMSTAALTRAHALGSTVHLRRPWPCIEALSIALPLKSVAERKRWGAGRLSASDTVFYEVPKVMCLQVPLQIPCYDLTLLVEGRLEYPKKVASPTPTKMV